MNFHMLCDSIIWASYKYNCNNHNYLIIWWMYYDYESLITILQKKKKFNFNCLKIDYFIKNNVRVFQSLEENF